MQIIASYDDNIPTSADIFVNNGAFDIARWVRKVSGYTLLRDIKLACINTQILYANIL